MPLENDQSGFGGGNDCLKSPLTLSHPMVVSLECGRVGLPRQSFMVPNESKLKLLIYWWGGRWVQAFRRRV